MDAANIRGALRTVAQKAGLDSSQWTPELRHSFESLMSNANVLWKALRAWWVTVTPQ
jgi:hypothetical protein